MDNRHEGWAAQRKDHGMKYWEGGHVQAKERGLRRKHTCWYLVMSLVFCYGSPGKLIRNFPVLFFWTVHLLDSVVSVICFDKHDALSYCKSWTLWSRVFHLLWNHEVSSEVCAWKIYAYLKSHPGLPRWITGKAICLQRGRPGFDPWIDKIPWRRKWQRIPSVLAWEIPWTEEPGRPQFMGSQSCVRLTDSEQTYIQLWFYLYVCRCWRSSLHFYNSKYCPFKRERSLFTHTLTSLKYNPRGKDPL